MLTLKSEVDGVMGHHRLFSQVYPCPGIKGIATITTGLAKGSCCLTHQRGGGRVNVSFIPQHKHEFEKSGQSEAG